MTLKPLPMTVLGGYLGAGKTTLLNRILRDPGGRRIMVMVNDFGAINIDADLLVSSDGDTIELSNGCVCCTMGNDLFMALGDAIDRRPRPDHLIIEASGVADPAKIAEAARAEPDMDYGGIVTLVDALDWARLSSDPQIGAQVQGQVRVADLVLVTKGGDEALCNRLSLLSGAPAMLLDDGLDATPLVLGDLDPRDPKAGLAAHPAYATWSTRAGAAFDRNDLNTALAARPDGIYRMKGVLNGPDCGWEIQIVGTKVDIRRVDAPDEGRLVAIGLADRFKPSQAADWWTDQT